MEGGSTKVPRATCDATGQCLQLGTDWYHLHPAQDLCGDAFRRLAVADQAGWTVITEQSMLGEMLERYSVEATRSERVKNEATIALLMISEAERNQVTGNK